MATVNRTRRTRLDAQRNASSLMSPLEVERYDLVIQWQQLPLPGVLALLDVLNRFAIGRKLELLAGYDTSHTGEVLAA